MKKKVMIISETTSGGVRKHILDLLLNIDTAKYDIYFVYSLKRADKAMIESISKLNDRGIHLIEEKHMDRSINPMKEMKALKELNRIIKEIRPDIVHCHSSKAGAIGRISAKLQGVKSIYYTPHAYIMQNPSINNMKSSIFTSIERVLSRYCTTKTINVSNGEKEFAYKLKIDDNNKFEVIYNGIDDNVDKVDLKKIKQELNINENETIVGIAARMDDQKDPFTFIKIAEKVVSECENITFIYIGDGKYKNEIDNYLDEKRLTSKIKLLGFRNDTERLLQIMDIYLITSLYESMPYSLIEALKYKLPIVATDVIGNNEVAIEKYNGLLFKVSDSNDGFEKVIKCIKDVELRKAMSNNSYSMYKEKFTIDKMIESITRLYESQ